MTLKDQSTSIRQKLAHLAILHRTTNQNITTQFLIERLLARIVSDQTLFKSLVFKGGYVGLRIYQSARYTVDLDALLVKDNLMQTLDRIKDAATKNLQDGTWFHFERQIDLKTQGEYGGIRLEFRTGIGEPIKNIKRAQVIQFDLGIGDPITPSPVLSKTKELISPESIQWKVYAIETIIAEKLHAWVDRGEANSRSKDLLDLYQFLPQSGSTTLKKAIEACFTYRKTPRPNNFAAFVENIDLNFIRKGWTAAVAGIPSAPTCEDCVRVIVIELKMKL